MTSYKPSLQISRLIVYKSGKVAYDETFHAGVNIIRGANSTGKSSISDFLFFALGGDVTKWKPEAADCDYLLAELLVNEGTLTIRRNITTSRNQPMDIFWGDSKSATASAVEGWKTYPFRRSEAKESFSQVLYRALGMPEVRSDADSNITMHQLLRLMFVDQLTAPDSLMSDEPFDSPFTRRTVGDFMFGVFDDELYGFELSSKRLKQDRDETKSRISALVDAFSGLKQETDPRKLEEEINEKQDQLVKITDAVNNLAQEREPDILGKDNSLEYQAQYEQLRRRRAALVEGRSELAIEIEDSEKFIEELKTRSLALEESLTMRNVMGGLDVQVCPQCLQPLTSHPSAIACKVCGQDLPEDVKNGQRLRMQQELALQIRESGILLEAKRNEINEIEGQLPVLRREISRVEKLFAESLTRIDTKRDQDRDAFFEKRGSLESEIAHLLRFHSAATLLTGLQKSLDDLESRIRKLDLDIETKKKLQNSRKGIAISEISKWGVSFLHRDLPSEEKFEAAEQVTVDFGLNSFSVDGRNQFSASSMTYLKNSVHFSILYSSLVHEFFRYPRILICDNMEDKGMVPARSQNFQRLVTEYSERFEVAHQIIFTTSMIAPELNNDKYCVGDEYSHTNKSLRV